MQNVNPNIVFVRHALAPGIGDPVEFDINNCSSQRNLDSIGKLQAKALGAFLQKSKIDFDSILSSEWCRCKETSELLNIGDWKTFTGLNSFFEGHVDKKESLQILNEKINSFSQNSLVLMVTHQVVISAVTGVFVPSGGMVFYNSLDGKAEAVPWKSLY
jgi:broad specificity phosphatase PhoE